MKRTDKEVQLDAIGALIKHRKEEESRRLEQENKESSEAFKQLKEQLPYLQSTSDPYVVYLGGYCFSIRQISSGMKMDGQIYSIHYGLRPVHFLGYQHFIYNMVTFGRFLEYIEQEKIKEKNKKVSWWRQIENYFAFNYE
jgi:NAD kinase